MLWYSAVFTSALYFKEKCSFSIGSTQSCRAHTWTSPQSLSSIKCEMGRVLFHYGQGPHISQLKSSFEKFTQIGICGSSHGEISIIHGAQCNVFFFLPLFFDMKISFINKKDTSKWLLCVIQVIKQIMKDNILQLQKKSILIKNLFDIQPKQVLIGRFHKTVAIVITNMQFGHVISCSPAWVTDASFGTQDGSLHSECLQQVLLYTYLFTHLYIGNQIGPPELLLNLKPAEWKFSPSGSCVLRRGVVLQSLHNFFQENCFTERFYK